METIDHVRADTLEVDDYINFGGQDGIITDIYDNGDHLLITLDTDGETNEYDIDYDRFVPLLGSWR